MNTFTSSKMSHAIFSCEFLILKAQLHNLNVLPFQLFFFFLLYNRQHYCQLYPDISVTTSTVALTVWCVGHTVG